MTNETALAEVRSNDGLGGWVPVAERMPASGQTVLACYTNQAGMVRRIRANWIAAKSLEAGPDDDESAVEYDEGADCYWAAAGWYEQIDNWGDYSAVAVTEGDVTHWMPLPAPPLNVRANRPARGPLE